MFSSSLKLHYLEHVLSINLFKSFSFPKFLISMAIFVKTFAFDYYLFQSSSFILHLLQFFYVMSFAFTTI